MAVVQQGQYSAAVCFSHSDYAVVGYWGQNGAGGEGTLASYCTSKHFNVIILSFMISFVDTRQSGAPDLNFANHCETAFSGYPYLLNCPGIAAVGPPTPF